MIRYGMVLAGAFGAYSLGANNIATVVGVFVPVSPFKDIAVGNLFRITGIQQLYLVGALSIVVGIYTYSHKVMRTVGKDIFQLSPLTALVALLAQAIVLFLFASKSLYNLLLKFHLPTIPLVPVSATQIIVGAVVGIGLATGGKNLRYNILAKISLAWILAPVLAFLLSYVALFITQNVFELQVQKETSYIFDQRTISKIQEEGYDIDALSTVNGRSFKTEDAVYQELIDQEKLSKEEILAIIALTEVHKMKVDVAKLKASNMHRAFSKKELAILKDIDGKEYRHKWQLREALSVYPEYALFPNVIKEIDKNHNRIVEDKLQILYRNFRIE